MSPTLLESINPSRSSFSIRLANPATLSSSSPTRPILRAFQLICATTMPAPAISRAAKPVVVTPEIINTLRPREPCVGSRGDSAFLRHNRAARAGLPHIPRRSCPANEPGFPRPMRYLPVADSGSITTWLSPIVFSTAASCGGSFALCRTSRANGRLARNGSAAPASTDQLPSRCCRYTADGTAGRQRTP